MQIEPRLFTSSNENWTNVLSSKLANLGTPKMDKGWQNSFKTSSLKRHLKSLKETGVAQSLIQRGRTLQLGGEQPREDRHNNDATPEYLNSHILPLEKIQLPDGGSHDEGQVIGQEGGYTIVTQESNRSNEESSERIVSPFSVTSSDQKLRVDQSLIGHHPPQTCTLGQTTSVWYRRTESYTPTRIFTFPKRNTESLKIKEFKNVPNRRCNSLRDFKKKSRNLVWPNASQRALTITNVSTETKCTKESSTTIKTSLKIDCDSIETKNHDNSNLASPQEWKPPERYPTTLTKATTKLALLPSVVLPWKKDDGKLIPSHADTRIKDTTRGPESLESTNHEESFNALLDEDLGDETSEEDGQRKRIGDSSIPHSPSPSYGRSSISRSEWDIHRPWSEAYTDDHTPSLSQSECRLCIEADQPSIIPQGDTDGNGALSLPYAMTYKNTTHNLPEGKFQKFKKSLSLRLAKKGGRGESPARPSEDKVNYGDDRNKPEDRAPQSVAKTSQREDDVNKSYFKFGHPLFRTNKERKRAKLGESRTSKCNSGDSGIEGNDPLGNGEPNEICRTAKPSEPTKQKVLRRTRSDMSKPLSPQRHLVVGEAHYRQSLGRQYSSPQPIKVRPFHRLPNYSAEPCPRNSGLKRSQASAYLRRSVSQPLDLDKSFQAQISFLKMRAPDEETSVKKQCRRPSVGNLLCDDNTSEDEGGFSDNEELRHGFKRCLEDEEDLIVFAEALWDHVSLDSDELVFKAGELITVLDSYDKDWWWGRTMRRSGWFPASFVRLLVNQEDHTRENVSGGVEKDSDSSRRLSLSSLSHDQVRANVINEILSTERDYVKHLRDVVEGYLRQVRKRPDMFSAETIATIFGNMESLYNFHSQFLSDLELGIDFETPHRSCIGDCFIRNKSRFEIYSEYCNNHPLAVSELQELYQDQKYVHFFEACRLLQQMIDISLDGFLLTPVQKICKYPLQLQELLKYTRPNHPDFAAVGGATQAMKEVALLVNERRRRMECLEKIASWQKGVEGWLGADLLDDSSQLIHQGEVTKGVGGSWPKEVTLFLFDHQMIYCKRDLLKRNTFVYRGRINTDLCQVIDIPDDASKSAAFQNAWKIHYLHKSKTYVFTCKSSEEKAKWLEAFRRERALVAMDESSGFVTSEKQKHVARVAARNHRSRPKKPRVNSRSRKLVMTYAQAQRLVNTEKAGQETRSNSYPVRNQPQASDIKKKGNWFSFGGHKKSRNSSRTHKNGNSNYNS